MFIFVLKLFLFIEIIQAAEPPQIKVYKAFYTLESSRINSSQQNRNKEATGIISEIFRQKQDSAQMLTKDVIFT